MEKFLGKIKLSKVSQGKTENRNCSIEIKWIEYPKDLLTKKPQIQITLLVTFTK